jgi:hypothetical protein
MKVLVQKWEESEAGWGVRPDGFSLHINDADRLAYIEQHWAWYRERYGSKVPEEYDRPSGTPYWVEVNEADYDRVAAKRPGVREFKNEYPGDGGPDGWRPMR